MAYSDSIRTSNGSFSLTATLTDALHTENYDGWAAISETFTYASASTITIATGGASRFQKGDKLRLTNTTVKYFNIRDVADTLLTVTGGTDYTLASAAISGVSLSRAECPFGFPSGFTFSPTLTPDAGSISAVVVSTARFCMSGRRVFYQYGADFTQNTSTATNISIAPPVGNSTSVYQFGSGYALYNGANTVPCYTIMNTTSNIRVVPTTGWTAGAGRAIGFSGFYYLG